MYIMGSIRHMLAEAPLTVQQTSICFQTVNQDSKKPSEPSWLFTFMEIASLDSKSYIWPWWMVVSKQQTPSVQKKILFIMLSVNQNAWPLALKRRTLFWYQYRVVTTGTFRWAPNINIQGTTTAGHKIAQRINVPFSNKLIPLPQKCYLILFSILPNAYAYG